MGPTSDGLSGPPAARPRAAARRGRGGHVCLLLTLCAVCFLPALGSVSLWHSQEGRVAWIVRTMLRTGDFLTPRGPMGVVFDDKPPLMHWLCALASAPAGLTAWSLRLPAALSAMALVVGVCLWGSAAWGGRAGLVAGLVLATSIKFTGGARAARVDTMLALLLTLMLAAFWSAYRSAARREALGEPRGRGPRLTGALIGFAVAGAGAALTKSPALMLLPVAAAGIYLALKRDLRLIPRLRPMTGLALCLLLSGWWFAAVHVASEGVFTHGFFVNHHWRRYVGGATGGHFEPGPIYGYLPLLVGGTMPWPLMIVLGLVMAARAWRRGRIDPDDPAAFLLVWIVFLVVFFSLGRSKRADYVLPVYPALALLVGRLVSDGPSVHRWLRRLFAVHVLAAAAIYVVLLAAATTGVRNVILRWITEHGSATDRGMTAWYLALFSREPWILPAAGSTLIIGSIAAWLAARKDRFTAAFIAAAVGTGLCVLLFYVRVVPAAEPVRGRTDLAARVRALARPDDRIVYVNDALLELSFYIDRPALWQDVSEVTEADVARWTDDGRRRCIAIMRREAYHRLVAPRERRLGLTVAVASLPAHDRPVVVLTSGPAAPIDRPGSEVLRDHQRR